MDDNTFWGLMSIFQAHDTHGIPIHDIADQLNSEGLTINWFEWTKDAIRAGWTYEKIKATITEINDRLYGNSWREYEHIVPVMYLTLTKEKK